MYVCNKNMHRLRIHSVIMHQSIPAMPTPPPPGQPRDICSRCQSRDGAFAILSRPEGWALAYPGANPRAFDTRVFERWMSLLEKTGPLSKPNLPVEGKRWMQKPAWRALRGGNFLLERKQGMFEQQKVENCFFAQKRWIYVTRLLVRTLRRNRPITDKRSCMKTKPEHATCTCS